MYEKLKKELILSLIKDDLMHNKLIMKLNAAGLSASNYSLDISNAIFELLGFEDNKRNEKIYQGYIALTKKASEINNSITNDAFNPLAKEIYNYLIRRRPKIKRNQIQNSR